jgi:phosphoserine phosphatase
MTTPRFGTVIFDCDSTLSAIEGIDELAAGHRKAIAALTDAAMRGEVSLEAVYGQRLSLIQPTREAVEALGSQYIAAAVPDARTTVRTLIDQGVRVKILSGGLRQAILPFAAWLGVAEHDVAAVDLWFNADGSYRQFDERSPLTRSGGKRTIVDEWRGTVPAPVLMVGDGITDLEARPAVDRFVAYAGVVDRLAVTSAADAVIRTASLLPLLEEVLHTHRG